MRIALGVVFSSMFVAGCLNKGDTIITNGEGTKSRGDDAGSDVVGDDDRAPGSRDDTVDDDDTAADDDANTSDDTLDDDVSTADDDPAADDDARDDDTVTDDDVTSSDDDATSADDDTAADDDATSSDDDSATDDDATSSDDDSATDDDATSGDDDDFASKCERQDPVPLTSNASAKRGLSVVRNGDVFFASWQGMPAGVVRVQYVLADAMLMPMQETPVAVADVTGADLATGYVAASASPRTDEFLVSWVDYSGATAYANAALVDGDGAVVNELSLGAFVTHVPGGRHRVSWSKGSYFFGFYWCASGGTGCPYPEMGAEFNAGSWLLIDDQSGVVTQAADSGPPNPGAHSGTQLLQVVPYAESESEQEGFLALYFDSARVGLTQYHFDGSYSGVVGLPVDGVGNGNAGSKFVWDGQKAIVFSQSEGSGAAGRALRQERWDLAGNREYEVELTTQAIEPSATLIDGDTVSLLAGNDAALYFGQSQTNGDVVLEPELVATGEAIQSATLLADDQGFVAFYLGQVDGTDQVLAARIECSP